ncbi:MAG TPA: Gldg family protein, partial [Planctomycetota bacterium]|nr:Gldg family protein [Planctomycetota bacterium]
GVRTDLTAERLGELAPATRELTRRARGEGALEVELLFTAREDLPPALRAGRARLLALLRELRRAGTQVEVRELDPSELSEERRAELQREGLELFALATRDDEVTRVRRVHAAVRIAARGRSTLLAFPDALAFEGLEFRLAFALWRLEQGRGARVAFASDVPRPSPAEAWEFQQQGLFSPMGSDVYALARERLRAADFDLVHVNPRNPELPRDVDALVWLQPRRSVERMMEALVHHLHGGGRALLAAQHFVVQSRQYRGANFEIVYWPQPQSPDVEVLYFPWIGVRLVREPFFDRLQGRMLLDSQMKRSAELEYRPMALALPFVVRASAASFEPSAVTRNLGDQLLPFAARFELEAERLAELDLRARTLIWSSPACWSFDWKGGWIPPELLAGPPRGEGGEPLYLGRQPLAVELEGSFPLPPERLVKPPPALGSDGAPLEVQPEPPPYPPPDLPPAAPGRLVFLGSSELFKNHRLLEPEFRADHLLLNAVASLALPEELAAVAGKRAVARGFGLVEPRRRLAWRVVAVGAFPALIAGFGLVWRFARRSRGG